MANYGFISILEEEMEKNFAYDFAINWDKRNHAVELSFILDAQNIKGIETLDLDDESVSEDIALEEFVLFYNPDKSHFDEDDYLVALPFNAKKGLSREFFTYFASFLNDVADAGLDGIMDFLTDDSIEEFEMIWDKDAFDKGKDALAEGKSYPYPRY